MDSSPDSVTSTTLLLRLRLTPADQVAWSEFVALYGRRIFGWCRQWGLQEADAHDVTQAVLLKLLQAMQTFRYEGNERARLGD